MYRFAKNQPLYATLRAVCDECSAQIETREPYNMPSEMVAGTVYTVRVPCRECEANGLWDTSGGAAMFTLRVEVSQFA